MESVVSLHMVIVCVTRQASSTSGQSDMWVNSRMKASFSIPLRRATLPSKREWTQKKYMQHVHTMIYMYMYMYSILYTQYIHVHCVHAHHYKAGLASKSLCVYTCIHVVLLCLLQSNVSSNAVSILWNKQ